MGISKQNDGTYRVSFHKRHPVLRYPIHLKRTCNDKRQKITTMAEANRMYRELVIAAENQINRKMVPEWSEFLQEYLKVSRENRLSESTIYNRDKVLSKYTLPRWANKRLDEIKREDICQIIDNDMILSKDSNKKHFVKCVKAVFQLALDRQFINRNPAPLLKFKSADKIKAVLNEDQIVECLRKAQECEWEWYPHYAMALFTGMRTGELYALTWDKVDLEKRIILVDAAWGSKNGFKSTKSGDDRIVEIPLPLLPTLQELKIGTAPKEFVLPRLSKWDKGEQARDLRFFLKANGLPELRFHDLRASWATMLLSKGVPPSKVMAMGGWKQMDTMMMYMRKAGIAVKGSTSVLDDLKTHGLSQGKLIEMRSM